MLPGIQYRLLRTISPGEPNICTGEFYEGKSKLEIMLGHEFLGTIPGKTFIDFGCGGGSEVVELARLGANRVIGIDIREDLLQLARQRAHAAGFSKICHFATSTNELAHVVVSIDAFEHFGDPLAVLHTIDTLLYPRGEVIASFGPTWYHPRGGHLFSVFPWAHLLFSEKALIRWRSDFKTDGATRFSEVAGGLNHNDNQKIQEPDTGQPVQTCCSGAGTDQKIETFA
jgi:SAM-dependent methyltransferase